MSITLGVFDIFTYAIPGSLYLALLVYVSARLHWIDPARVLDANTTLVLIAGAVGCYLIGHLTFSLGRPMSRGLRVWRKDIEDARKEFAARTPAAEGRPFLNSDRSILQAAVEVRQQGAAIEIIRLRAVGLMLRSSAPAFALGCLVSISEIVASTDPGFAVFCSVLLLLAAIGSLWHSARLTHWANMKTLDLAFWIPGIDENLHPELRHNSDASVVTGERQRAGRDPEPKGDGKLAEGQPDI